MPHFTGHVCSCVLHGDAHAHTHAHIHPSTHTHGEACTPTRARGVHTRTRSHTHGDACTYTHVRVACTHEIGFCQIFSTFFAHPLLRLRLGKYLKGIFDHFCGICLFRLGFNLIYENLCSLKYYFYFSFFAAVSSFLGQVVYLSLYNVSLTANSTSPPPTPR